MACHAIDQKRLGPSMKEAAAKYNGDGRAADMLAKKIRVGSVGVWGQMPTPPQPQVAEADAKTLAEYILTVKLRGGFPKPTFATRTRSMHCWLARYLCDSKL